MNVHSALLAAALSAALPDLPAAGQEATPAAASRGPLRIDGQMIGAPAFVVPSKTPVNPGNRVLRIPRRSATADVRADARVEFSPRWQFVVRPRVRGSAGVVRGGPGPDAWHTDATLEMTEAFLAWRPADRLSFTYGLQNFQWGPAEMTAPSNRLFHEIGVFRDPLYLVRGRHLARLNLSAGRQWSLVALAELGATGEPAFRAGARFRRAGQAKVEYATASGATYAGITAGARGGEPPWAGGYAATMLTDALSAYVDASFQRGSQAWYPVEAADGSITFETSRHAGGTRLLALAGLRCSFSAVLDARLEYLRQDAGYTRAQIAAAPEAVLANPSSEVLDRWLRPGLEFLGRDIVLASILSRDLPPAGRLDLHTRYVRSLTDRSGAVFATASLDANDALVVFASMTLSHGANVTEFARLTRAAGTAGLIWSW